jgi:hypothetical protein
VSFDADAPRGPWDIAGIHGLQRLARWDAVVTAQADDLSGDRALFVALPGRAPVIEEGPGPLEALADAVDAELARPYRAEGVRREGVLWVVGANAIEVVDLPGVVGDEIELVSHGGDRMLTIDGERSFVTIPPLERPDRVVRARRIVDEVWELQVDAL